MSNNITNRVKFTTEEDFKKAVELLGSDKDDTQVADIDFNKLIPVSEDLNITSGSGSWMTSHYGFNEEQYNTQEKVVKPIFDKIFNDKLTQEEFTTLATEKIMLLENSKEILEKLGLGWKTEDTGEYNVESRHLDTFIRGYYNLKKYGYTDWYKAHYDMWGTKWNAYDTFIDNVKRTFEFITANSAPIPVYQELADRGLKFAVGYADEDTGSNYGLFQITEHGVKWVFEDDKSYNEKTNLEKVQSIAQALAIQGYGEQYAENYYGKDNYTDREIKEYFGLDRDTFIKSLKIEITRARKTIAEYLE